ncbi:MAG TPA: LacI family DNA-binding transcriptional regulator [Solirubrobacteraceae bacterium]|nr:LacI family DNA-binding transcriptional regulator [Solirubrobacteraceae bacterium]
MGNRVTLKTIADALGVSRTTVSNAYNRPDQLAPELRDRILGTARELGYAGPDPAARRLRSGRRDTVGLLVTEGLSYTFTDPASVLLLQGIARATEDAGLSLLVVPERAGIADAVVDAFCLYSLPAGHPNVPAAQERGVPLVVVDEPRLEGHAFVGVEDRRGAELAAEHLLALGHRRFALLADPTRFDGYTGPLTGDREASVATVTFAERLAGYRGALVAAGIDWASVPRFELAANLPEHGLLGARMALATEPRPTALIAGTDQLALGAIEAAREAGLRVPEDLSVVGFDDVPGAAWSQPALTTVRQPLLYKGELAGRMLAGGDAPREVILPVELVVRGSTARAP